MLLQFGLCVAQLWVKFDAFDSERLLLAMIEARQSEHTALVDAGAVAAKLLDQTLLNAAECSDIRFTHEPVGVQRFASLDHNGRFQWKSSNLRPLLFQGNVITFHELCVDAGDVCILMATSIHHEVDAAHECVMLLEQGKRCHQLRERRFQFHALERSAVLAVIEHAQADFIGRFEERAKKLLQGDVLCFHSWIVSISLSRLSSPLLVSSAM